MSLYLKVIKNAVASRFENDLVRNMLQDKIQSESSEYYFIENTMLKTTNDTLTNKDNNEPTALYVLIDQSSAFDLVDH